MKEKKHSAVLAWAGTVLLLILGLAVCVILPSYRFSGYLLLGAAALAACFRLLTLLQRRHMRLAKALRMLLSICLCLGLLVAAITGAIIYRGSLGDPDAECQYIIVLGAGVNGTVPSLTLRERINAAFDYLTAHPDTICIVSGGQGRNEDISEAACMYRELTDMGIPGDRIWLEDKSTSTTENLDFSLAVIEEKAGQRPGHVGLVSSEYHLFRAGLMAADKGLTATGIPGETSYFSLWLNYFLREIAAVWAYLIFGG